jgi:hypothetical protein
MSDAASQASGARRRSDATQARFRPSFRWGVSPGEVMAVGPGFYDAGYHSRMRRGPMISLASRHEQHEDIPGPGPGRYLPDYTATRPAAPRYTLHSRNPDFWRNSNSPGSYVDLRNDAIGSGPRFSMKGGRQRTMVPDPLPQLDPE